MTPEAQRIAIAESCGYSFSPSAGYGFKNGVGEAVIIPDYLNDLNAMAEAEKILTDSAPDHEYSERDSYGLELLKIVGFHKPKEWGGECQADFYLVATATASQRAEAFLRCIGAWKD